MGIMETILNEIEFLKFPAGKFPISIKNEDHFRLGSRNRIEIGRLKMVSGSGFRIRQNATDPAPDQQIVRNSGLAPDLELKQTQKRDEKFNALKNSMISQEGYGGFT